jgi:hypothetical protein
LKKLVKYVKKDHELALKLNDIDPIRFILFV